MRALSKWTSIKLPFLCAPALLFIFQMSSRAAPQKAVERGLDVRIVTEKLVYRRGSTIDVEFVIKNTGDEPLYLFRGMGQCSSQIGSFDLQILDQHKNVVTMSGCSADLVMEQLDAIKTLTNTVTDMVLKVGEVYRYTASLELPKKKGKYELVGEAACAGFTEKQRAALAGKHMRVMVASAAAPIITISVK
jgi:hypothetical protein